MNLQTVFEDDDCLVINKPAGLAVHGGANIEGPTLVDFLMEKYPKIASVGDDKSRPGIVHRLDKEVSGLMVVAKSQAGFENLKDQFKNRTITKEYVALAYGKIPAEEGEINFPIKRSRDGYRMAAIPLKTDQLLHRRHPKNRDDGNIKGLFQSREALTYFQVLKRFVNYTLLRVRIKTGRTHQIRVHLFAYGYPLVGDNLYATPKTTLKNKKLSLGRVFLVADHLSFRDLAGETRDFRIDLPTELEKFLLQL